MGRGHFLGVLDVNKIGEGILGAYGVKNIIIGNTSMCKEDNDTCFQCV